MKKFEYKVLNIDKKKDVKNFDEWEVVSYKNFDDLKEGMLKREKKNK
jgi:hypothetical protein